MQKKEELTVFISNRDSTCAECDENLGRKAWICLREDKGALCLSCADLDHLVFLPTGDAALTRRSKKHSKLYAVVLKWSRARKRYERQGLLVEADALSQAEEECLEDSEVRERRRERDAERREFIDQRHIDGFQTKIEELFPECPKKRARAIAEHACLKYSGRVGRSASARHFEKSAIELAVRAHLRHTETDYDDLLTAGVDRREARRQTGTRVEEKLREWSQA